MLLYKYRNIDKIMGFSKLSNDWIFLAVADIADINTPVKGLWQVIAVIVIMIILFGAAVTETNDEIGNMARSLSVMSQKLETSQKDLLELNNSMKI